MQQEAHTLFTYIHKMGILIKNMMQNKNYNEQNI